AGKELMVDEQKSGMVIQNYMMKVEQASAKVKEKEQADFLAKNKTNQGVQVTETGLQYKIENAGNDIRPAETDTVEVNYKGTLLDGTVFDSSYDRKESVKFPLNAVIKGWTEGLQLLGEGGKATLWIPYELGYGPRQMSPTLPGYSTLVFEVELIKVIKAKPQAELAK
ncbi:MAG: FKBP-type peptidyl-prolyl cis-trans isomerase, partial [Bacteroidales bacterium]